MVARPSNCDPKQLRRLLEDHLEDEEQAAMARHLEGCASCRSDLEHRAAESRWWGDARLLAGEPPPTAAEPPGEEGASLDFLGPPAGPGQLGTLGAYEVLEVIGRGGMGLVLKAFDRPLGRFVAIKVLAPELATSASARRRFAREAQAAAAISHDHIVAIYAVDETPGGLPFLVMPCIAGRSLQERLDRSGPLALREILRIGMQAASGLAAAHAVGLVHRDVKPANILLENCVERVKLTDFGLARAVDDASLTQSGVVAGTPQYMAPEQARGEAVDARADLFSLGSVLYALCTGHPPFRAATTMGVLRRVCEDTPRPIRELNPEVPDWFQAIVARLQAKDPAARFGSAAEVADLLGRCLAYLERPDATSPPFLPEHSPSSPRLSRSRTGMFAAVAAVAVLAGLGASEASGVSHLADLVAAVLRIPTPEGTLVIQVDDPEVKVRVDGDEVVLSGAGPQEVRLSLRGGQHQVETSKAGAVERELVTITRGAKQTVRATLEPRPKPDTPASVSSPPNTEMRPRQHVVEHADPATIERLEARIKALEGELQTREQSSQLIEARSRQLEEELRIARVNLARLEQSAKKEHAQAIASIKEQIRELEGELSRKPASVPPDSAEIRPPGRTPRAAKDFAEWLYRRAHENASIEHPNAVFCVAVSPDGKTVAVGCNDGSIRLWDVASGGRKELRGHASSVRSVAFSPDGRLLASAGGDYRKPEGTGEVKLWDLDEEGHVRGERELKGHTALVWSVAFSLDGQTLATGSWDKTARLWDVATGETKAVLEGHTDGVRCIAFALPAHYKSWNNFESPLLATAGFDGDVRFWHTAPGRPVYGKLYRTYHASDAGLSGVAFAPDGRTVAISPRPSFTEVRPDEVILFDLVTWQERARLKGHRQAVLSLAFSPDGKTLASGGGVFEVPESAGEVFLWDVMTGRAKSRFAGLKYWVESVAFSPDGKALISGGGVRDTGGEVRFWDPNPNPSPAPPSRQ